MSCCASVILSPSTRFGAPLKMTLALLVARLIIFAIAQTFGVLFPESLVLDRMRWAVSHARFTRENATSAFVESVRTEFPQVS